MIVTCPSCEAKYRVEAEALEARRGKVKCASCAHVWTVDDDALALSQPVEPVGEPAPALAEAEPRQRPSLREKPAAAIRARQDAKRRKARLAAEGAGWMGVTACIAVLLGAAVIFRVDVVDVWPRSAGAYAAVGLDVNPYGVEIEGLRARFETVEAAPVLLVSGELRNITAEERPAPPLQAVAYGEDGSALARWPIAMEAPSVLAQSAARFEAALPNPPENAVRIEVVVAS
jgi:predicted Zn finger-like uncharacterized protein